MNNDAVQTETEEEIVKTPVARPRSPVWVTGVAVVICLANFLGLSFQADPNTWEALSSFGVLPATSIWDGHYWSLVSSAFVHIQIWHLVFNVYWLWVLGSLMERIVGSLPFLIFILAAAFVSSSFQLAFSDTTGIGASGVVYAIFGFLWGARGRNPGLHQVLTDQVIFLILIWMAGCFATTHLGIWNVGNAAHLSGLLFGLGLAGSGVPRSGIQRRLILTGWIGMILFSFLLLIWCPWSVVWLSTKAYDAHANCLYDDAIQRYTQVIRRDPDNAWAYLNRSSAYQALGRPTEARTDRNKALELDLSIEKEREIPEGMLMSE